MRRWHSDAKPTAICAKSRDRNFEGLTPTFSPSEWHSGDASNAKLRSSAGGTGSVFCNALLTQSYKVSVSVALLLAVFGSEPDLLLAKCDRKHPR